MSIPGTRSAFRGRCPTGRCGYHSKIGVNSTVETALRSVEAASLSCLGQFEAFTEGSSNVPSPAVPREGVSLQSWSEFFVHAPALEGKAICTNPLAREGMVQWPLDRVLDTQGGVHDTSTPAHAGGSPAAQLL